jgi:peptidoglycan hydrolase-like protein with peptidoglycan-binding domain
MTPGKIRLGLAVFCTLSIGVAVNLLLLQPVGGRLVASRQGPPLPTISQTPSNVQTGALETGPSRAPPPAAPETAAATPEPAASAAPPPVADKPAEDDPEIVRGIQRELHALGYETGAIDGKAGIVTRASIIAYEYDRGLPLVGEADDQIFKRIVLSGGAPAPAQPTPSAAEPAPRAQAVIRTVQQWLAGLGYKPGKINGRLDDETVKAIRAFEAAQKLPVTGRVSGLLVGRLIRLSTEAQRTANR